MTLPKLPGLRGSVSGPHNLKHRGMTQYIAEIYVFLLYATEDGKV